ncbi:MAG: hypothetical protein ACE144_20265 [Thermodesulfobacteriota bacterium]
MKPVKRWGLFLFLSILFILAGCAPLISKHISQSLERPRPCEEFLNQLDARVEEADVRDAANVPVPGFPYLRTNRFLTALKKDLKDERAKEEWVRWMQKLDLEGRKKEINNLPNLDQPNREELLGRLEACSSELLKHDRNRSDFYQILYSQITVPDEYSFFRRAAGLYPLMVPAIAVATAKSRKKIRSWYEIDLKDLPVEGELKTFVPERKISLEEKEMRGVIEESMRNPLNVPLLNREEEKRLAQSFAPIFTQNVAAPYDRLGRVVWKDHGVEILPERPTVYYYFSHAFLKGNPILQINYVIWYSERAGQRAPWMEHGHLDGLTARVSLDAEGRPFMVDVVNDCGCYHIFSPDKERVDRVISQPFGFDPFVPQWLPPFFPGGRLGIRINSGWHQVERLIPGEEPSGAISYELVPYNVLETLPHEDGQGESIFDRRGIAKDSKRAERFILFSMGIPSIGSMRQRGHHAIDLIERIHFDDPYLFDENFIFK